MSENPNSNYKSLNRSNYRWCRDITKSKSTGSTKYKIRKTFFPNCIPIVKTRDIQRQIPIQEKSIHHVIITIREMTSIFVVFMITWNQFHLKFTTSYVKPCEKKIDIQIEWLINKASKSESQKIQRTISKPVQIVIYWLQ